MASERVRLMPWQESYEVRLPDGTRKFFYFDENAGRRSINGRLSQPEAPEQAKKFAREEQDKLDARERS